MADQERDQTRPASPEADQPESSGGAEVPQDQPEDIEALRQELAQRNDQLLRLAADFENFRRRKNQELADRARYASEDAARALLPVLDNLRRAVEHAGRGESPAPGGRRKPVRWTRSSRTAFAWWSRSSSRPCGASAWSR